MSDAFYIEIRDDTVIPLLDEFGTTYTVRAQGVYNPDTGSNAPTTTRQVQGVVADQTMTMGLAASIGNTVQEVGGTTWIGRKNLLLSPTANLLPNEEVEVDGKWYPVSVINELKPANIIVLYILDLTR